MISSGGGWGATAFLCLFGRDKRKYFSKAYNLISDTLPIGTRCKSVCTAHQNVTDHGNDIGVELERVAATTKSARLRDDGIRPVIYPTHSDPQTAPAHEPPPGVSLLPASSRAFPFFFFPICQHLLNLGFHTDVMLFTHSLPAKTGLPYEGRMLNSQINVNY